MLDAGCWKNRRRMTIESRRNRINIPATEQKTVAIASKAIAIKSKAVGMEFDVLAIDSNR